jgi:hypothetical protein
MVFFENEIVLMAWNQLTLLKNIDSLQGVCALYERQECVRQESLERCK